MNNNFVLFLFIYLIVFIVVIKFTKNSQKYFMFIPTYNAKHKIHDGNIPRSGGIFIFLISCILSYFIIDDFSRIFINYLTLSFLPLFFMGIYEDLFNNSKPIFRIMMMILSFAIFILIYNPSFPLINIPYLEYAFQNYYFCLFFFLLCLLVLINGLNLIDGVNGLMSINSLLQLIIIYFLSLYSGNELISNISIFFIIPLIAFIILNFPLGKIFMGDTGAYFYGFLITFMTLHLFSYDNNLITWHAVLILLYPLLEICFTLIRRLKNKKKISSPDNLHLHSLIFSFFKNEHGNKRLANNLAFISLIPLLVCIYGSAFLFYDSLSLIVCSIFFNTVLYLSYYKFFFLWLQDSKKSINNTNAR